jgi:prepilin-type processing-associated H-X9-DG protein
LNSTCSVGNVDYTRANQGATTINAGLNLPEGSVFWPNSFHPGGVHFVFGDGHAKFISQSLDGLVYARLLSPQGTRVRGPLAQGAGADDY